MQASKHGKVNAESGILLYHLASKIKAQISSKLPFVAKYIGETKLNTTQRVDAALQFLLSHPQGEISVSDFEEACGVGVIVTPEEVKKQVEQVIEKNRKEIVEKR